MAGIRECFSSSDCDDWWGNYNEDGKHIDRKVSIGNDVWIGANVFINASRAAIIGDGAIVGSGSVVMDDIPPYAIVVGQPSRIIRYRFTPKQIDTLLYIKWWEWCDDEISRNSQLLIHPELFFERFE